MLFTKSINCSDSWMGFFDVKTGSRQILTQLKVGLSILKCTGEEREIDWTLSSAELCDTNVGCFNIFFTETL